MPHPGTKRDSKTYHRMQCCTTNPSRMAVYRRCFILVLLAGLYQESFSAELRLCARKDPTSRAQCSALEAVTADFKCVYAEDSVDCLNRLESDGADLGVFSAEEALVAAADKRGQIVVAEVRHIERSSEQFDFKTVAVVRATHEGGIEGLRGKNYCHPGFTTARFWSDPIMKALEKQVIASALQCNQNLTTAEMETKALSQFFGKGCRPGNWNINDYRNGKLKATYRNLCALCDSTAACSYDTSRVGSHVAAMTCLTRRGGDVVYNALSVVKKYFVNPPGGDGTVKAEDYNFLCSDGSKQPLSTAPENVCSWIRQPWSTILAPAKIANTINGKLKDIFPNDISRASLTWSQRLKAILAGDSGTLMISTASPLESVTTYISKGRTVEPKESTCSQNIKWCTTSADEKKKCQILAVAVKTHGISPGIECPPIATNVTDCLRFVNQSDADIAVISTNDGFVARRAYNLQPVMYLEGERTSNYNGIIVINGNSTIATSSDLKGKRACFPTFNGLGWLTYMQTAWKANQLPSNACPASSKTLNFFGRSCAPGVNDKAINVANMTESHKLCEGCSKGTRGGNCLSSTTNPYYGELGALRCLSDGVGDVAFLDYNAALKILGSKRQGTPDAGIVASTLRVLCKDNTKAELNSNLNLDNCVRNQVIGNEVVKRKNLARGRSKDIQSTLEEIDSWFGTMKSNPILNIFGKYNNASNVLLPSHGVDLINIYETEGTFVKEYVDLHSKLQHCSGANSLVSGTLVVILIGLLNLLVLRH